jgi:hypothetical protein
MHGVLGITVDGHLGRYDRNGQWHPATALEIAGIGPTEGTHLPVFGVDRPRPATACWTPGRAG